ncbi:hypothetical protein A3F03_02980 [Candidatus Roizmanbacteria bacterium RIFCSPHIGHO2_12_FULL_41_11]|uniref:Uncharacterized protein n=1 Tax=Candidatus Roizmanbacteria bacterium RIFCSPHIGHO2_12_FULL_41_11 TaxID=1802052 RepID=A0A1F7HZX4_9BACT|nr:MAG: hypothetical protein A3F03_02980 [Candidatus Roizmanbacteria bacterium RIFCSPHIGHO2_12_FULL_41_11]
MLTFLFTKTPLLFFVQSFWRDEAFSFLLAKQSLIDILFLTAKDFNPPLYYLILHLWLNLFGSSEITLRTLSLIFFTLTIYKAYDMLTDVLHLSPKKTILYLFLFLSNPVLLYYAFEVRMYAMMGFLAVFSFQALLAQKHKTYILVTTLALYTHYFMLLVLAVQIIWSLMFNKKPSHQKHTWRMFIYPLAFFLPWLIFFLSQKVFTNAFWITKPNLIDFLYLPAVLYTGYEKEYMRAFGGIFGYRGVISVLAVLLLALIGSGARRINRDNRRLFWLLLLWAFLSPILVFIISFVSQSYYLPRYLLFSTVGFIFLLVYLLESLPRKVKSFFILFLLVITLSYQLINLNSKKKFDFSTMSKDLKMILKPQDRVYVTDERDFQVAQYYLGEDRVFIYGKSYENLPAYIGKVLIDKDDIRNQLPLAPIKAAVIVHNRGYYFQMQ